MNNQTETQAQEDRAVQEKVLANREKLILQYFVTRNDALAFWAPWGAPCRGAPGGGGIEALVRDHVGGAGAAPPGTVTFVRNERQEAVTGPLRIGFYALDANSKCRWMCIDIDGGTAHSAPVADPAAVVLEIMAAAGRLGIPAYAEKSGGGKGWHVWVFFSERVSGAAARKLGFILAPRDAALLGGGVADPEKNRGIEVFPKCDQLSERGVGSQVWAPWWWAAPGGANRFYRIDSAQKLIEYEPDRFDTISATKVDQLVGSPRASPDARSTRQPPDVHESDSAWARWRKNALEKLDLEDVYGEWLTGRHQGTDWLECRDPRSETGDRTPSAGVANGTGDAERGRFHSFRDATSLSVFDFLVELGGAEDFGDAKRLIAKLSGVPLPGDDEQQFETALKRLREIVKQEPSAAIEKALQDEDMLAAIGRLEANDLRAYQLLRIELDKAVPKSKHVPLLLKAAAATWKVRKAALRDDAQEERSRVPVISVNAQFRRVDDAARAALLAANSPPSVFRSAGVLVRVCEDDAGARLIPFTDGTLTRKLSDVANWFDHSGEEPQAVYPERRVVESILDGPPMELPVVERVAKVPLFARDGRLIATDGYHYKERAYVALDPELQVPVVPELPTAEDVSRARELLVVECLGDFPFAHPGDRAHALAMIVGPFVQALVDGVFPLHALGAPESGTGKSLLGDVAALIATGSGMRWRAFPKLEEEREKAIFTALRSGGAFVAFDNVKGTVESPALESALTSEFVQQRLLGGNTEAAARNRAIWVMSANNAQLSRDLERRSVRSRLDARIENPELRSGFRHPNLRGWISSHRGELVAAVLTLVQNWLARGRPVFSGRALGSFERWSSVMGGILEAAGVDGFLHPDASLSGADPKRAEAAEFVTAWNATFRESDVTARTLLDAICAPPVTYGSGEPQPPKSVEYLASVLGSVQVAARAGKLGRWLSDNVDRIFAGYRIEKGDVDGHAKVFRYRVIAVNAGAITRTVGALQDHVSSCGSTSLTDDDGDFV